MPEFHISTPCTLLTLDAPTLDDAVEIMRARLADSPALAVAGRSLIVKRMTGADGERAYVHVVKRTGRAVTGVCIVEWTPARAAAQRDARRARRVSA